MTLNRPYIVKSKLYLNINICPCVCVSVLNYSRTNRDKHQKTDRKIEFMI